MPSKAIMQSFESTNSSTANDGDSATPVIEFFRELPLEILFQIFENVEPIDLLQFARTTKHLRGILMSKTVLNIWKRSLERLPGGENPPLHVVSAPELVNVVFGRVCHLCPNSDATIVWWAMRRRFCSPCTDLRKHFVPTSNCGPSSSLKYRHSYLLLLPILHTSPPNCQRYCVEQLERMDADFLAVQGRPEEDRDLFVKKQAACRQINSAGTLCEQWDMCVSRAHEREVRKIIEQRRKDIIDRLSALGWADEMALLPPMTFENHPLLNERKTLTDNEWECISGIFITTLEMYKAKRLAAARKASILRCQGIVRDVLRGYSRQLDLSKLVIPTLGEVLQVGPLRALLDDTPHNQELSRDDIERVFPRTAFETYIAEWRDARDAELLQIMDNGLPTGSVTRDCLYLATTLFRRRNANQWVSTCVAYPTILTAKGSFRRPLTDEERRNGQLIWAPEFIIFDEEGHARARDVVAFCGLNPDKATKADMDALDPWVHCTKCVPDDSKRLVLRWDEAIRHLSQDHGSHASLSDLRLLGEQDRVFARRSRLPIGIPCQLPTGRIRTQFSVAGDKSTLLPSYTCVHCDARMNNDLQDLWLHMITKHAIMQLSHEDFHPPADADTCGTRSNRGSACLIPASTERSWSAA
ncbi:hypothetical protein BD626DRAFT_491940 [Schizophyllum amplum]|uniref:F-box domain-containing protein n=1 Tax=Schizophyllum amplum TaxID=97359 RepID=A0A550CI91_9AGAR|nr:hypothetical protein BD626DRAFT_491940 [Auriculariopsis ampla]